MTVLTGEWGTVRNIGDTAEFIADRFSTKLIYATVPFLVAGGGDPANGDTAFLHFDSTGQPAYAVIWPA